jgi:hypothetical protein
MTNDHKFQEKRREIADAQGNGERNPEHWSI